MENLIIQTAYLGDLILSIPLMRQLVELDPEFPLAVVCRQGLGEVVAKMGLASRVIEVQKRDRRQWRDQRRDLLAQTYRHVICPHESVRSALLVASLRAAGKKIGFHKNWNFFAFTERVEKPRHLPDALRQLALLAPLSSHFAEEFSSVAGQEGLWNHAELSGPLDFRGVSIPSWARLSAFEPHQGRRIFIAPGSVWATKRWSLTGFTALTRTLTQAGWEVTLVGSPEEKELGAAIVRAVPAAHNCIGEWSLSRTIEEFKSGRALVANDSGAIHLAALAGLPTVAIFGPTTLALGFRPWQEQAVVVQNELQCRPCGAHGHQKCPISTHECMVGISVEQVLSGLHQLIKDFSPDLGRRR